MGVVSVVAGPDLVSAPCSGSVSDGREPLMGFVNGRDLGGVLRLIASGKWCRRPPIAGGEGTAGRICPAGSLRESTAQPGFHLLKRESGTGIAAMVGETRLDERHFLQWERGVVAGRSLFEIGAGWLYSIFHWSTNS